MLDAVLRYTAFKKRDDGQVECENIIQYLCKFDQS